MGPACLCLWGTLFIFYQHFPINGPWLRERSQWARGFSCSTFAHPLVLAQHVARGTFTLVWTHHVHTAEGTQQRILGTLVDVWTRTGRERVIVGRNTEAALWKCRHGFTYLHMPSLAQAQSRHHTHTRSHQWHWCMCRSRRDCQCRTHLCLFRRKFHKHHWFWCQTSV